MKTAGCLLLAFAFFVFCPSSVPALSMYDKINHLAEEADRLTQTSGECTSLSAARPAARSSIDDAYFPPALEAL